MKTRFNVKNPSIFGKKPFILKDYFFVKYGRRVIPRDDPLPIPPRVQYKITGKTRRVEGVLPDLLTPILTKIGGDPMIYSLIELHRLISENIVSEVSNLRRRQNGDPALAMTADNYMEQTGYLFVPLHNPGNYSPTL